MDASKVLILSAWDALERKMHPYLGPHLKARAGIGSVLISH
jgi:hypothetical protein